RVPGPGAEHGQPAALRRARPRPRRAVNAIPARLRAGTAISTPVSAAAPLPPATPAPAAKAGEAKIIASAGAVSIVNYGYTLALIWMLPAGQYAIVGSASALLLICGTVS